MKKQIQQFFDRFCADPQKALLFYLIISIICWTLQCSLLQNVLGLDVIEALTWGNQGLVWGHAKHPPLSGWLGEMFRMLSGGHDWGLYLGAQLAMTGGVWFTYLLGMRLFHDRFRAATGALLLCFLSYYTPSEMRFCTYPVAMFLAPFAAWSFVRAAQSRKTAYFLLFGFSCALAILNKYSEALLLSALLGYSFCDREYRKLWRTPGPYLAGILFFALISPHLVWLCRNDFCCLRHVADRLDEAVCWYAPPVTAATVLYPFAAEALVLGICAFFTRRFLKRKEADWKIFRLMMGMTLPGCIVLLLSSLLGKSVITMWFCSLVSFTGIAMVAAFPFEIGKRQFRIFCLLLWIYASAVFTGTTADLLFSSRERLHTDPQNLIRIGKKAWRDAGQTGAVPVIIGDRWYGGVFENYSQERPHCVEIGDRVALKQYRKLIQSKGALLLIADREQLEEFFSLVKKESFSIQKTEFSYGSVFGRKRISYCFAGVLEPGGLIPEKAGEK